ncbi:unnamed protein product [Linum trigynum]|uniref:Uncharacterized protein n=1 Tax=Linum trigynum TaxID=586398 RepID=A0AAV2CF29_9ROSI
MLMAARCGGWRASEMLMAAKCGGWRAMVGGEEDDGGEVGGERDVDGGEVGRMKRKERLEGGEEDDGGESNVEGGEEDDSSLLGLLERNDIA